MTLTYGAVFAGIGGLDRGFDLAGFKCRWQVEIDPQCRCILRRCHPDAKLYADVRYATAATLSPVDVIVGGFPCQDISAAGLRKGLVDGHRSSLFFELARIVGELKPRVVVWENVKNLLSSKQGRDLARVLMEFRKLGYAGAWTGLDSRFFGVAQRRQRVFGVFVRAEIGLGACVEMLRLLERSRTASPKPGAEVAATMRNGGDGQRGWTSGNEPEQFVAAPLVARQGKGGFTDPVHDNLIAPLAARMGRYSSPDPANGKGSPVVVGAITNDAHPGGFNGQDTDKLVSVAAPLKASAPGRRNGGSAPIANEFVVSALVARRGGADAVDAQANHLIAVLDETQTVTHTLSAQPGCTEDGRGRGIPLVAVNAPTALAFESRIARNGRGKPEPIAPPLKAQSGKTGKGDSAPLVFAPAAHPISIYETGPGIWQTGDIAGTLRAEGENRPSRPSNVIAIPETDSANGDGAPHVVSFTERTRDGEPSVEAQADLAYALLNPGGGGRTDENRIAGSFGVRRLTPVECERLQAFPDGYTEWGLVDGPLGLTMIEMSDSARYRMLGNAVTVNVAAWLALQLKAALNKRKARTALPDSPVALRLPKRLTPDKTFRWLPSGLLDEQGGIRQFKTGWHSADEHLREVSLSEVLEPVVDTKYFLSALACFGVLRRAKKRGRSLPPILRDALQASAERRRPAVAPTAYGPQKGAVMLEG